MKKTKDSRLVTTLVETAEGMHRAGLLDRATYEKIAMRHATDTPKFRPLRRKK